MADSRQRCSLLHAEEFWLIHDLFYGPLMPHHVRTRRPDGPVGALAAVNRGSHCEVGGRLSASCATPRGVQSLMCVGSWSTRVASCSFLKAIAIVTAMATPTVAASAMRAITNVLRVGRPFLLLMLLVRLLLGLWQPVDYQGAVQRR